MAVIVLEVHAVLVPSLAAHKKDELSTVQRMERMGDLNPPLTVAITGSCRFETMLSQTVNGLFKTELVRRRGPWRSLEHVELAAAEWIDWWNHTRLHSSIGDVPPAEYEAAYHQPRAAPNAA